MSITDNHLVHKATVLLCSIALGLTISAEELKPISLFDGSIPKNVKASTWKTMKVSVDNDHKLADGTGSLKVTSDVGFAGCNYAFQDQSIDLTPYWQSGALSFQINRSETMDLGSLQLVDKKTSVKNSANSADMIPKLDDDVSTWQQVIIPLKSFADEPFKEFTGFRIRAGRAPKGAVYLANIQVVSSYDPKSVKKVVRKKPKPQRSYFPKKGKYGPVETEGQSLVSLKPNAGLTVKALPVRDCRFVRGFFARPVDGRIDSYGWECNGPRALKKRRPVKEWPNVYSGVDYSYNNNDGIHVTVDNQNGIDLVTIEGGYVGTLLTDAQHYAAPYDGKPLTTLKKKVEFRNLHFQNPVQSKKISFVDFKEGLLANVAFYKLTDGVPAVTEAKHFYLSGATADVDKDTKWYIGRLFDNTEVQQVTETPATGKISATAKYLHFVIPASSFNESGDYLLDAVTLNLSVAGIKDTSTLHVRVADPFNPRLALAAVDFKLNGDGDYAVSMDVIDQVVPASTPIWVTVALSDGEIVTGEKSFITLQSKDTAKGLAEYINYRKLLFKNYFSIMIEQRPWFHKRSAMQSKQEMLKMDSGGDGLWELVELIKEMKRLAPQDHQIDIYYKQVFGWSDNDLPVVEQKEKGPDWAVTTRKNFEQLLDIAYWWIINRQTPNGEFGGAVNDDSCLLMNFQNYPFCDSGEKGTRLREAYRKLAEFAAKTTIRKGLNIHKTDPLHSYEEGVNIYATMPRLFYGDPVYIERCMESVQSLNKITRIAPDGKRYFFQDERKVGYLNDGDPTDWHFEEDSYFMMVHAALTVAWYNQHPAALKFLREIFDGYLSHMTEDKWPSKIYPADGKVTYRTNRPLTFKADSSFVYMYNVTSDDKYLSPFFYGFAKNNWGWASHRSLLDILLCYDLQAKYKIPDDIKASRPYINFLLSGDKKPVVESLQKRINHNAYFDYFYKDAELFVDRIFVNNDVMKSFLGGVCQRNTLNSASGVEWGSLNYQDYAAFVLVNHEEQFKALVYNFTDKELKGTVYPWQLKNGIYTCRVGIDADENDEMDEADVTEEQVLYRHKAYPVTLKPGKITVVDLKLKNAQDDIRKRPDLAICAREISLDKEKQLLTIPIHNIGCTTTGEFTVQVLDATGAKIAEKQLPAIEAPLSLDARVLKVELALPPGTKDVVVCIDPANQIAEITEENNKAKLTF